MDGLPNPFDEFEQTLRNVELAVDSAGDSLFRLIENYAGRDKLRLWGEAESAVEAACSGLHLMASVAAEVQSQARHLKIATEAGNAPVTDMDQEGTREHSPSQPASVAQPPERKT